MTMSDMDMPPGTQDQNIQEVQKPNPTTEAPPESLPCIVRVTSRGIERRASETPYLTVPSGSALRKKVIGLGANEDQDNVQKTNSIQSLGHKLLPTLEDISGTTQGEGLPNLGIRTLKYSKNTYDEDVTKYARNRRSKSVGHVLDNEHENLKQVQVVNTVNVPLVHLEQNSSVAGSSDLISSSYLLPSVNDDRATSDIGSQDMPSVSRRGSMYQPMGRSSEKGSSFDEDNNNQSNILSLANQELIKEALVSIVVDQYPGQEDLPHIAPSESATLKLDPKNNPSNVTVTDFGLHDGSVTEHSGISGSSLLIYHHKDTEDDRRFSLPIMVDKIDDDDVEDFPAKIVMVKPIDQQHSPVTNIEQVKEAQLQTIKQNDTEKLVDYQEIKFGDSEHKVTKPMQQAQIINAHESKEMTSGFVDPIRQMRKFVEKRMKKKFTGKTARQGDTNDAVNADNLATEKRASFIGGRREETMEGEDDKEPRALTLVSLQKFTILNSAGKSIKKREKPVDIRGAQGDVFAFMAADKIESVIKWLDIVEGFREQGLLDGEIVTEADLSWSFDS